MPKKREGWYDEVRGRLAALERSIADIETRLAILQSRISKLQGKQED